jgi:hypothetical protein
MLCNKHSNKFVVIKDCKIIGVYNSFAHAYDSTIKTESLGTFIIKVYGISAIYLFLSQ